MQVLKIIGLLLLGTVLALAAGALFFLSLFEAPKLVAGWMPSFLADRIGLDGVALFGATAHRCNEGPGAGALRRILDRLQSGSNYGRRFQLHIVEGEMENAFALPGRHIIVVSGLVRLAKSPEEIAGVLAHEMGHGIEKDPEALFLRNIGMNVILKVMFTGDDNAAAFRAMLSQTRYARDTEIQADAHAVAILRRARIASKFAGEFILRGAAENPSGESVLDDLGAHLSAEERAKAFLAQPTSKGEPILSEEEWAAAKTVCAESAPAQRSAADKPSP